MYYIKDNNKMKRCDVCDSTESYDTLKDHGLNFPIRYWTKTEDGWDRCDRCQREIDEALMGFGEDETDE